MVDSLFHAYTPLVTWISLGVLLVRFIPAHFSTRLGRGLYWIGLPLQSIAFARQTQLSGNVQWIPLIVLDAFLLGIGLAILSWWGWHRLSKTSWGIGADRSRFGSFLLASTLGNTGFIGMELAHVLIDPVYLNWAVLYSVSGTITYSLAVFLASYFGQAETHKTGWRSLRDAIRNAITVPNLWAFAFGLLTQDVALPAGVEVGLQSVVWIVFASALLLMGLRLGAIKGWSSLELALMPTLIKVLIVPALIGLGASYFGVIGNPRLVLVLMAGAPTGLAALILAEVYDLDRELLTSAIALTFVGLLLMLPLWLLWFG